MVSLLPLEVDAYQYSEDTTGIPFYPGQIWHIQAPSTLGLAGKMTFLVVVPAAKISLKYEGILMNWLITGRSSVEAGRQPR